jgi:hypothetical protein
MTTSTTTIPDAACTYTLGRISAAAPAFGKIGIVRVISESECTWTASTAAPWITLLSRSSGTGNGFIWFWVASNKGAARTGTITIADQTFTISQSGR